MLKQVMALMLALAACSSSPATPIGHADLIVVHKQAHSLTLFRQGRAIATYAVALGGGGLAPKQRQGDRRTPEGRYLITGRNAASAYHRSLRIGYPTAAQSATARSLGIDPGGDIMIHGLPNGQGAIGAAHRLHDWTDGCIALTDAEIETVWRAVPNGTAIVITP